MIYRKRVVLAALAATALWAVGCGTHAEDEEDSSAGAVTAPIPRTGKVVMNAQVANACGEIDEVGEGGLAVFASKNGNEATAICSKLSGADADQCAAFANPALFKVAAGHAALDCVQNGIGGKSYAVKECGRKALVHMCGAAPKAIAGLKPVDDEARVWCGREIQSKLMASIADNIKQSVKDKCHGRARGLGDKARQQVSTCVLKAGASLTKDTIDNCIAAVR